MDDRDRWQEIYRQSWGDGISSLHLAHAARILEQGVRPHFVYLLTASAEPFPPMVKIGTSTNVHARVKEIAKQIANAPDWLGDMADRELLHLMGYVLGDQELERALHRAFAAHRIAGEWFWLEPIEEALDYLVSDYCVCPVCLALDEAFTVTYAD